MNTVESIREVLGWCSAINMGVLVLSAIMLMLFRTAISRIHARMFGLNDADLSRAYFQFLAQYKIAIIVFNLVPYIALRIMA
jgi:hypothetical protein